MQTVHFTLMTPLGALKLSAESETPSAKLAVRAREFRPHLPAGMTVEKCWANIFTIFSGTESARVLLKAHLHPKVPTNSFPETGEGLEAQAWEGGGHVLTIGTEDVELLHARIGNRELRAETRYEPTSFTFSLSNLAPATTAEVHLMVAWNHLPETIESSCWYAVDQSHHLVAAQVPA